MEGNAEFAITTEDQPREKGFIQKVEKKFNSAFEQALNRDKIELQVKPFFSVHRTIKDMELLDEEIRNTDIYIPEVFGWKSSDLEILRNASLGVMSFDEIKKRTKSKSQLFQFTANAVHSTKAAIDILDVPANHKLEKQSRKVWNYEPPYNGDLSQTLEYTRGFLGTVASHIDQREEYILSQITSDKVEDLMNAYPSLKSNKEINILFSIGLGHSAAPADFPENSFTDQGIIMQRQGKLVDNELASKIYLESFFDTAIYGGITSEMLKMDSRKVALLKRQLIGQLNVEDAERIFNYLKTQGITPRNEFNRIFDEKGIKLPNNETEIDSFLANSTSGLRFNDTNH